MIIVRANARNATYISDDLITSGSVGIPVEFVLSEDFDGLAAIAVFEGSGEARDVALMGNTCVVPHEVLATAGGYLRIGIYASNSAGTIVIPTVWAGSKLILQGTTPSEADPAAPTPSWVAQVQEAAAEALQTANNVLDMTVEADTLPAGSEATVEKSIDPDTGAVTLEFGIPRGEQGVQGEQGIPGKSGVYVGAEEPTDPDVNVWIDPNGSPYDFDAGAVAYDSESKYPDRSVGQGINDLKSQIEHGYIDASAYIQGARNQKLEVVQNNARCTTQRAFALTSGERIETKNIPEGFKVAVAGTLDGQYVYDSGWKTADYTYTVENEKGGIYFVNIAKLDGSTDFAPSDVSSLIVYVITDSLPARNKEEIDALNPAMFAVASDGLIPVSGEPWTYGRYINAAGAISNSAGMWLSGFVPISYGRGSVQVSYTYNSKAPELRFAQYDSNMMYIAGTYQRFNTTVNRVRINLSQTAKFILFSIGNWNTRYEIAELTPYFSINFETAVFYLLGGDIIERNADQMATLVAGVDRRSRAYDGTIKKNFALEMITDTHGDSLRTQNAVDLLNGSSLIDGAIHLGDAINSAYNTTEMGKIVTIINKAEKPFLTVMGNHDGRMRANTNCTVEQATAAYMGATSMSANYQARGYGYYDFSDYKIRVVMLNNYDFPDDKNGSDWVYYGASTMYLQAQINWFLTTLSNTPADYSVIVASHYSEPTTIDQTILNQHVGTVGVAELSDTRGGVGQMGDTIIADIINAFINRTTLTKSYTYDTQGSVSGVSVSADFSARSASNFICYICGHVHCQGIGSITNYPGQLSYFNDTGCIAAGDNPNNMWPTYSSLIPRNGEDRTQDLITVLCVDTDNKRVSFVRVGADRNMFGEDSSFIAHTY